MAAHTTLLGSRLDTLRRARGAGPGGALAGAGRRPPGRIDEVVADLLERHYDPIYLQSTSAPQLRALRRGCRPVVS
jgi:hypothetical protein